MRILFASVLIWCFSVSPGQEAGFFLKKKRVVKTKLALSTNALYPGEDRAVGIEVSLKNGKSKWAYHSPVPKGEPYKNQSWADFEVKISGAQLDNGHIIVPRDYRLVTEKNVTITIVNKNDRSLKDSITLPISFCHAYTENYNGQNGKTGNTPGTSSLYLLRDGYDGKNGENGTDGKQADTLGIYVKKFKTDSVDLFKILIRPIGKDSGIAYLYNHACGLFTVNANGGKGGNGGTGEAGRDGKDAVDSETPSKSKRAGDGGNGGNGSNGGNGGNGGIVYIFIEKGAEEILNHLYINYFGGAAGNGGEPGQGGKGGKGTQTQEAGKDGVSGNSGLQGQSGKEASAPIIYYLDIIPEKF